MLAGGLVWFLWNMMQKLLEACACLQGEGFPSSHGRSRRSFRVVVTVELGFKIGSKWAERFWVEQGFTR